MTLLCEGVDVFNGEEGDLVVYPDPYFAPNVRETINQSYRIGTKLNAEVTLSQPI